MSTLKTQLNPRGEEFRRNADAMTALVADLQAKVAKVADGGGKAARDAMDDALVCLGMALDKRGDGVRKY